MRQYVCDIVEKYQYLLQRRGDKRKINKVWWFTNRLGERFLFGKIGKGKKSYIKTLAFQDGNIIEN